MTVWLCPASDDDSVDTRWFAAIAVTSATVRVTVWGWSDWPRMSRLIALGAVSWAPVMTAPVCPWFELMSPVLSAGVPPPDGAGVGAGAGGR